MNYANFTVETKQRLSAITMYTGWLTLPRLGTFTQAGQLYPGLLNIRIHILTKYTTQFQIKGGVFVQGIKKLTTTFFIIGGPPSNHGSKVD